MNAWLIKLYLEIRSSYWFIPTTMAIGAALLSLLTNQLDVAYGNWMRDFSWLSSNQPEGARAVLSAIASSMITVAGVTFSMTMVAISFASAQFGPRLIGNFMRDRGNQTTLGAFIATFVYCLLILRTVRSADRSGPDTAAAFVPHFSLLAAIVLALTCVAVLIYFIHHVPETINIGNITARVGHELKESIQRLFPECVAKPAERQPEQDAWSERFRNDAAPIEALCDGYVQAIDVDTLIEVATENDLVIRLHYRPGDFAVESAILAKVFPATSVSDEVRNRLLSCFAFGNERTSTQDTLFLVDELVEILGRALSPGVNDPFTAIECAHWLHVAVMELTKRRIPEAFRYDEPGKLRLVAYPISFEHFTSAVFDQSRPYVSTDRNATLQMMHILAELGADAEDADYREIIARHADQLAIAAEENLSSSVDREEVARRHQITKQLMADESLREKIRDERDWYGGSA